MIPRMTGRRKIRWRAIAESIGRETCAMTPLGVRTATDQLPGPRIITPSRTAWPPTLAMARLRAALGALCALEPLLEALDAAARVHELLLARVERVAVRAHLDVQLRRGGTRLERVPAGAGHRRDHVLGMDVGLHRLARIAAACWDATLPPETTATTVWPGSSAIFPASNAAVEAAAPSSQASFIRAYTQRNPSCSSSSERRTVSTPSLEQSSMQASPANGALNASAALRGVTGTEWPAARPEWSAVDSSGSTPMTRASGRRAFMAAAIPLTSPPPPTGTITTSGTGPSSRISSATVPWPAMTAGSLNGCTSVRPVSSISSSRRANAVVGPSAC